MSPPLSCTGVPISWLRLERYHMGELDPVVRAGIDAHLATCTACATCLRQIEAEDAATLPPLALSPKKESGHRRIGRLTLLSSRRASMAVGAFAVAAAVILAMRGPLSHTGGPALDPTSPSVKGGEVTFTLVRDDGERVDGETGAYRDGDRFKALVTCPPAMHASFDLLVFDEAGASFPLAHARSLSCGNEVPLPGAFRLMGMGQELVCVVWLTHGTASVDGSWAAGSETGGPSVCKRLRGVP
jgi:Putative zinc-finger